MCGEKRQDRLDYYVPQGSPPHVRGKDKVNLKFSDPAWITPAYAGKSKISQDAAMNYKDHPRVCGEKISGIMQTTIQKGSPPRMRGKGTSMCVKFVYLRITPAYAGKRANFNAKMEAKRDHPRVCGEKLFR